MQGQEPTFPKSGTDPSEWTIYRDAKNAFKRAHVTARVILDREGEVAVKYGADKVCINIRNTGSRNEIIASFAADAGTIFWLTARSE